jgi:soluble lytic murein transglycosylase
LAATAAQTCAAGWAARARESLGEYELAASRYALVRIDYLHSYYGRLAAEALEQRALPLRALFETTAVSSDDRITAALPPSAEIIHLLLSTGLYDDALNELRYAQHAWGDSSTLQATLGWLHHQWGDLLLGANMIKRAYPQYLAAEGHALPSELATVIFPMGYWSLIQQYAATHSLDPYLLAALVAQESGFIPDIRSSAKATGLMQLMPATAQRYARKLAVSPYSPALLTRPETNVRLGTAYFADLVREFEDVHLALAGYNAGENRVRRWVSERPGLAPDEFVDDIPFPETQNYVKKILGVAENYRRVYGAASGTPSDPDRAIPSLASRRSSSIQPPFRPATAAVTSAPGPAKANRASAAPPKRSSATGSSKAKPGTASSGARSPAGKTTRLTGTK